MFHRVVFCISLLTIFSLFTGNFTCYAQEQGKTEGTVILDGNRLFVIRANLGSTDPQKRAKNIVKKLERLAKDPDFDTESISAIESEGQIDIVAGDIIVISVTEADAAAAEKSKSALADSYVAKLKTELAKHKAKKSIESAIEDASAQNILRSIIDLTFEPTTLRFITALVGTLFISLLVALIRRSAGNYIQDSTKRYASKKIIDFIGCFVGLIFVTVVFRDTLGNLAVIVGAATAGIAFALKEVIVSIAGWIAVTFGDFYSVGDRIQLGGIKGDVIDIGFGRTTLMELGEWVDGDLYSGRIVRVANSFVFSQPFFNYSGDFPFLWDECKIPVKYGSDRKLARQILEKVSEAVSAEFIKEAEMHWGIIEKKFLVENAQTSPMVTLVLNDNWMEFTVRYVVNYKRRRVAKDKLFSQIMDEIDNTSGKVGLASATFQLVETPIFEVKMMQSASKE